MKPASGGFDSINNKDFTQTPIDKLGIRIFVPEADGSEPVSSCNLIWNEVFPKEVFDLADIGPDNTQVVSIDREGVVSFSGAVLVSTARPVQVLAYTATGPEDSNGGKIFEAQYPAWTQQKLAGALNTLLGDAKKAFDASTEEIFVSTPIGGRDQKDFGEPIDFTSAEEVAKKLVTGEIGQTNLEYVISSLSENNGAPPRFVILGRTGLAETTNYCAQVPEWPKGTAKGSILIDFVPKAAVPALSPDMIIDLTNPPFDDRNLKEAVTNFAARCPDDGSGLAHWILIPDLANSLFLADNLKTLSRHIFGGLQ